MGEYIPELIASLIPIRNCLGADSPLCEFRKKLKILSILKYNEKN